MTLRTTDQWSALAGLRFILALIVACSHLKGFTHASGPFEWLGSFGAFEAILGFLLVSGYSVGSSYIKETEGFFRRRLLRVYPIYLVAIAFTAWVSHWCLGNPLPGFFTMLWNLLFLNQVFTDCSFVGPSWTLALEVWLYCLCPLLLKADPRMLRLFCFASFACYAAYTLSRSAFHLPYYAGIPCGGNLLFLSFAWICGLRMSDKRGGASKAFSDITMLFILHLLIQSMLALISRYRHHEVALFATHNLPTELKHAITLLLTVIVFCHWVMPPTQGTPSLILRVLGDISYPLYLLHFWVFALLSSRGFHDSYLLIISSLALSFLVYFVIDRYSRRRHLEPSRA